jgi:hypothetical protein
MQIESLEDVQKIVAEIEQEAGDPEVAHRMEDELFEAVLRYIASGATSQMMAIVHAALASKEIQFSRYYA